MQAALHRVQNQIMFLISLLLKLMCRYEKAEDAAVGICKITDAVLLEDRYRSEQTETKVDKLKGHILFSVLYLGINCRQRCKS